MNDKTKLILKISKLEISDEDKEQLIDLLENKSTEKMAYEVGKNYLIRGVTMIYTGRIKEIIGNKHIILEKACWIADTKRWFDCLQLCDSSPDEAFDECEPYVRDVIVHEPTIIDATEIKMLPSKQV